VRPQTRGHNSVKSLPIFKIFFTDIFLGNFAVKYNIENPATSFICCHTTLWNVNARKQTINDKLQGSEAIYIFISGVVGLLLTKLRKIYCWVCQGKKFWNRWISAKERGCLVNFLRLLAARWPGAQSAGGDRVPACNFASDRLSNKPLLIWLLTTPPRLKYVATQSLPYN